MMLQQKILACAVASTFATPLYAANVEPIPQAELAPVLVTADRNAQTLDKAAPNVSVIGRKTLNPHCSGGRDQMPTR